MPRLAAPRTARLVSILLGLGVGASAMTLRACRAYDRSEYDALTRGVGGPDGSLPADADANAGEREAAAPDAAACDLPSGGEPCAFIARLAGEQVLDGRDDEFCGIAERVFVGAKGVAASVEGTAVDAAPSGVEGTAHLRVAWSARGLHVFARVDKSSVITAPPGGQVYIYDALEVFAAGSSNLTGPYGGVPGTDRGAVHVIVAPPSSGAPGQASLFQVGGNKVADLLPSQFAVVLVPSGFAVELALDWGILGLAAAPAPGALIAFDVALDLRFPADGGTERFQSYLGVIATTAPAPTACRADAVFAPFCDDRIWCTPTLQ
jgi:hypothetical protein